MLLFILAIGSFTFWPVTDASSCSKVSCQYYSTCEVRNGTAACYCKTNCPDQQPSVCGSDGTTYTSRCQLERTSCSLKKNISVAQEQKCRDSSVICKHAQCKHFLKCEDNTNSTKCVCKLSCPAVPNPICGSDNQTYRNDCFMKLASCHTKKDIVKAHTGTCGDCLQCQKMKKFCEYHDTNGTLFCSECPIYCPSSGEPRCGSDGKTYTSLCHFNVKKCKELPSLSLTYNGTCSDMNKHHIIEVAVGISLGVLAICGVIVFVVLMYFFRFRIPKKAKRIEEHAFANDV